MSERPLKSYIRLPQVFNVLFSQYRFRANNKAEAVFVMVNTSLLYADLHEEMGTCLRMKGNDEQRQCLLWLILTAKSHSTHHYRRARPVLQSHH